MFPCQNPQTCEFGAFTGNDGEQVGACGQLAVGYGGFPGAHAWAGYVCAECADIAASEGFRIWELVGPPTVKQPPH